MLQWTLLLSFGQDNTVSLPPSSPPVCFLLFSLSLLHPLSLYPLLQLTYAQSSLFVCDCYRISLFQNSNQVFAQMRGDFFFNAEKSAEYFYVVSPTNPSVWESVGSGNHVAWDAGFFVYYIKRM